MNVIWTSGMALLAGCGGVRVSEVSCYGMPEEGFNAAGSFPLAAFCDSDGCRPIMPKMDEDGLWTTQACDEAGGGARILLAAIPFRPVEYPAETDTISGEKRGLEAFPLAVTCYGPDRETVCYPWLAEIGSYGDAVLYDFSPWPGYHLVDWTTVGSLQTNDCTTASAGIPVEGVLPIAYLCWGDGTLANCGQDWSWTIDGDQFYSGECANPDVWSIVRWLG